MLFFTVVMFLCDYGVCLFLLVFFFFKQKTAYELRISDWSSDVCSSDLAVSSIEKVIPNLEDLSTILRILARSATGQEMSCYTTLSCGPKRPEDIDGPEEFHVVQIGRASWRERVCQNV